MKLHFFDKLAVLATVYVFLMYIPATFWFQPISIEVVKDKTAMVLVNRKTFRDFYGRYFVDVRDLNNKNLTIVCSGSGEHSYKGGLSEPYRTSLFEWAGNNPKCALLPTGNYSIETCWVVIDPFFGIVPDKKICIENFFSIKE